MTIQSEDFQLRQRDQIWLAVDGERLSGDGTAEHPSIMRSTSALSVPTDDQAGVPEFSEEALALRFSTTYAPELRYVAAWNKWMLWDGKRWKADDTLAVLDRSRAICRAASAQFHQTRLAQASTVAAVERLARADRRHATTSDDWDQDVWLLNTPIGTTNLRTGLLEPHRREQYLTKMTAVGPDGECPLWYKFLERITNGDQELQRFFQRIVGYSLTGSVQEHALFFFHGNGANGKSVFLNTITGLLGDYARSAPASTFTAGSYEQHPTDVAGLRGARFVTAVETEEGRWWAEAKVKQLTGGDRITARFMRQDFFEFSPQFKLIVAGNHQPGLKNVDEAMRRRLRIVPFNVTIPEPDRDPTLQEKLKAEYPGILRWAIEGCLEWQCGGLQVPPAVEASSADYMESEDQIASWIEDHCTRSPKLSSSSMYLYEDFKQWCQEAGEPSGTMKRFVQALKAKGFKHERAGQARGFRGIDVL